MNLEYLHRPSSVPKNESRPLLVLLHGYGSNMQDLFSFAPEIPAQYEVVSLNAPLQTPYGGNAWYEINFTDAQKFNNVEQARTSIRLILEDIQSHCKMWNCPYDEVNICGFSQGGILSYALSLEHPNHFHKVLCLSCYPAQDIIGPLNSETNFSQLNFYISHGLEDAVIPIDLGRMGEELMEKLGIDFTFKEYHSGHGINPQNFKDLIEFLS